MKALDIKKRRVELGLTQDQLASEIGVSKNTILNYEKGKVIPDSKQHLLYKILYQESHNITLNEPQFEYKKLDVSEEKIFEIKEKIKTREDYLSDLENSGPKNKSKIEHQKEIISLLKVRLQLMTDSEKELQEDLEIERNLDNESEN